MKADLHGLDRIVGFFEAVDLEELGGVGEEELVDDFEFIIGRLD